MKVIVLTEEELRAIGFCVTPALNAFIRATNTALEKQDLHLLRLLTADKTPDHLTSAARKISRALEESDHPKDRSYAV